MTTHTVRPSENYTVIVEAGNVLRASADAAYAGMAWFGNIGPNDPRMELSAEDDLTFGPFLKPMAFRVIVTAGSVQVDDNYRPSIDPLVHNGTVALVNSRMTETQREAIDALVASGDGAAEVADVVEALQAVPE